MRIGIQLTKNPEKYKTLLSILKSELDTINGLEFIHISTDENLTHILSNLDILTTYHINKISFACATDRLKWIHFGVAGLENNLFADLLKSKTIITNASGIHAGPVSEFVIAAILYFSKRIKDSQEFMLTTTWKQWEVAKQMIQLKGKTLGIIGFGSLGKAIANKAKAFDMKVIATRRLQKKVEHKKTVDELIPVSNLSHLLKNSDFVVIACPLTPVTKNMIGKRELSEMKSTAFIINIARGEIINEDALLKVLQNKTIAGAALDVFENEPTPAINVLMSPYTSLSPHIGAATMEAQDRIGEELADQIIELLK